MTTIVVLSLFFCVLVVVAGIVLAYFGVDVSVIVGNALTVFGTELGICGVMTMFNRWVDRQDKQIQKREEKRKRQEEKEGAEKREFIDNTKGDSV
jgi:heme O synthase-like polyprenyltransferase